MSYTGSISRYITYAEAIRSSVAVKQGIDNTPTQEQFRAMKMVARMCFDPVREFFGKPIRVNSFFRSFEVNTLAGGAKDSQHLKGEAIDMDGQPFGLSNDKIFHYILQNLTFDQLIWEFGDDDEPDWVHVSFSVARNRAQALRSEKVNGITKYYAL